MMSSEVPHTPDHNLGVYKEEKQSSKPKVVLSLVLVGVVMLFSLVGLFYFFSKLGNKPTTVSDNSNVYVYVDENSPEEVPSITYDTPEEILTLLPERFKPFPIQYVPYLRFVDKNNGDPFSGYGFFYYKDLDDIDGLIVRGIVKDWGETTVRLDLGNESFVDLLIPFDGVTEYIDGTTSAIVSDERKAYYIDKAIVAPLELTEDNFTAISFAEYDKDL